MIPEDVEATIDNLQSAMAHGDQDGMLHEMALLIGGMALNLARLAELAAP